MSWIVAANAAPELTINFAIDAATTSMPLVLFFSAVSTPFGPGPPPLGVTLTANVPGPHNEKVTKRPGFYGQT